MSLTSLLDPQWDETLDELTEIQRGRAREFAREAQALARLEAKTSRAGWQDEQPFDSLVLEVAGSCLIGQHAASERIDSAVHLVRQLPVLLEEMDAGRVLLPQARAVIEETRSLSPQICAELQSRILPDARELMCGPLRRKLRALILAIDAEEAARRAAKAGVDRGVTFRLIEDSQALLIAKGPAVDLRLLDLQLDAEARALRATGDPRTMEQLRFDLLCQHQAAAGLKTKPILALIHVPVATGLGLSDEPGILDGYGPLPAAMVRELLTDAVLRKVCVDKDTGRVIGTERRVMPPAGCPEQLRRTLREMVETSTTIDLAPEPRHDPSAGLAREVRLRDAQCDGVGCSQPASRCELDHRTPYPEGPTSFENLRPRSQRCHHARHSGWTVVVDPDGTTHWTSPSGRTYTVPTRDRPPPPIEPGARLPTPADLAARDLQLLTPRCDACRDDPCDDGRHAVPPEATAA